MQDMNILETAPVTLVIVVITVLISYRAFNNRELLSQLLFHPNSIAQNFQENAHRFITSGFVHRDWIHLIFNMFVLYEFGRLVESSYSSSFGNMGRTLYLLMYLAGIVVGSLPSYLRNQNNPGYAALGASGAVSGVVLAFILFKPLQPLRIIFFPFFGIPAVVLGILYLAYSSYMSRRGGDGVAHDAHLYGALFGFLFTLVCDLIATDGHSIQSFATQVQDALGL